jgi:hypothetical protein
VYENIPVEIVKPIVSFVYDPDMDRENLVEAKHRRLVRSHRSGPLDRELKPNAKLRDEIYVSISRLIEISKLTINCSAFVVIRPPNH